MDQRYNMTTIKAAVLASFILGSIVFLEIYVYYIGIKPHPTDAKVKIATPRRFINPTKVKEALLKNDSNIFILMKQDNKSIGYLAIPKIEFSTGFQNLEGFNFNNSEYFRCGQMKNVSDGVLTYHTYYIPRKNKDNVEEILAVTAKTPNVTMVQYCNLDAVINELYKRQMYTSEGYLRVDNVNNSGLTHDVATQKIDNISTIGLYLSNGKKFNDQYIIDHTIFTLNLENKAISPLLEKREGILYPGIEETEMENLSVYFKILYDIFMCLYIYALTCLVTLAGLGFVYFLVQYDIIR